MGGSAGNSPGSGRSPSSMQMLASPPSQSLSCLAVVRESLFLHSLLLHLDALQHSHPYLSSFMPSHRRALEMSALSALAVLAPKLPAVFLEADGLGVLALYMRCHSDVLIPTIAAQAADAAADVAPLATGAGGGGGGGGVKGRGRGALMDGGMSSMSEGEEEGGYGPGSGAGRTGGFHSSSAVSHPLHSASASSSSVLLSLHREHDSGRLQGAMRVLSAMCSVGIKPASSFTLSDMLASARSNASAAKVVAPPTEPGASAFSQKRFVGITAADVQAARAAFSEAYSAARFIEDAVAGENREGVASDGYPLGYYVAALLGELGEVRDLLTMLKALPMVDPSPSGGAVSSSSAATSGPAGPVKRGMGGSSYKGIGGISALSDNSFASIWTGTASFLGSAAGGPGGVAAGGSIESAG